MTEPTIQLRPATPDDIETVVRLSHDLYAYDEELPDQARYRAAVEQLIGDPSLGRIWMIEADGAVAGYAVLAFGYSLEFGGRDAYLDEIVIDAPFRKRGIGTRALNLVLEQCPALGIHAVHLEVDHANTGAQALYRRFGFVDHHRYLMTRRIEIES